jgi:hypothetical protein
MSRTGNFIHQLCGSLEKKKPGYMWKPGTPPFDNRECVDAIGEKANTCVLVEVELRGTAPVTNIVKIWKWLGAKKAYTGKRVILLQAFSAFYNRQSSFSRDNAKYLGNQMEARFRNLKYIPIDFKFRPSKKRANVTVTQGGGAMRKAARKLASQMTKELRSI